MANVSQIKKYLKGKIKSRVLSGKHGPKMDARGNVNHFVKISVRFMEVPHTLYQIHLMILKACPEILFVK